MQICASVEREEQRKELTPPLIACRSRLRVVILWTGCVCFCGENRVACINKEPAQTLILRTIRHAVCFHDAVPRPPDLFLIFSSRVQRKRRKHRLYPALSPDLSDTTRLQSPNEREATTEVFGGCRLEAQSSARSGKRLCRTGWGLPWQRCPSRSQLVCLPLFQRKKIKDG